MGLSVQKHIYHSITRIAFDESFSPLQWAHLPRHQVIGENNRPAWVFRTTCDWVEISSEENTLFDARYQSSELLVKRIVERYADEEVLKKWRIIQKYLGLAYNGGWYNITL